MLHHYKTVTITETSAKVLEIWHLFNRLQAVGDNREHCTLELSEDGYGWVNHIDNGDYLEFPCGTREVTWDTFDKGIEVLTVYLQEMS